MRHLWTAAAIAFLNLSTAACADEPPPPPPGGEPPAHMLSACDGKAEGDAVTLTMPNGDNMPATCHAGPKGKLMARPDHMPNRPDGRHGPGHEIPAAFFSTCAEQVEGASVSLTTPRGDTLAATCVKAADGRLVARPNDMPKPR